MSTEMAENPEHTEIKVETTVVDLPTGDPLVIQNASVQVPPSEDWVRDQAKISAFFKDPINYSVEFLQPYKPIFVAIGLLLLGLVALRLLMTILSAILSVATSIPVLSHLLELVGIGYTVWFIYRYLITAAQRQELSAKLEQIKQEFIGIANGGS
ncbi:MAG: hypothetical protein HC936_14725 [Leptolyngbyaceae cyanobacterium SU_3_3]|nr:hypothetical protein [Leptolyngbyaceae cyanobacterium SU_3_3]NJR49969.1 hypothetical protein [Leptolyngbyaceae cyanobacterium CSU_1_3]